MTDSQSPYNFLVLPASSARGNVTLNVTNVLREAIVSLDLRPGEMLDKGAICQQLGVSRFPVSEAFARLQGEGLVDILPQRGSVVSRVRIADVAEFMLIRKALESEAVRAIVGQHVPELVEQLRENLMDQREAGARDDGELFHQYDLEVHELLFGAMRYSKVKAIIDSARANLDRARRLILTPRRLALTIAEHEVIVQAIMQQNADAAAAAMRTHLDNVMVELLAFAQQRPELFADGGDLGANQRHPANGAM